MKNNIEYKVQSCNGNYEVIKVINGHADEIISEHQYSTDAITYCSNLNSSRKLFLNLKTTFDGNKESDFDLCETIIGLGGVIPSYVDEFLRGRESVIGYKWDMFRLVFTEGICTLDITFSHYQ